MPNFDLSFGWIVDRSALLEASEELNSHQPEVRLDLSTIHPKSNSNDVRSPEDSYFYLLATKGKLIANENSNGSFLAHQHANKKNIKTPPYMRFFREINKQSMNKKIREC